MGILIFIAGVCIGVSATLLLRRAYDSKRCLGSLLISETNVDGGNYFVTLDGGTLTKIPEKGKVELIVRHVRLTDESPKNQVL